MRGPFLVVNMRVSWAWFVAFAVAWLSFTLVVVHHFRIAFLKRIMRPTAEDCFSIPALTGVLLVVRL